MNGEVCSLSRSVATTAAVCRRRSRMRSAIVPSPSASTLAFCGPCESASSCGGDGALRSLNIVFSSASIYSFSVVGAAGGAVYGTGGVVGVAGGDVIVSPGNDISTNCACGDM
eukprot:4323799-Pleurochrysis_carterae.AAC.1